MDYEELKKQKEIIDFAIDIKEITKQQNNPTREGLEKIILNIKNKYFEIELYEKASAKISNSIMTDINYISNDNLYNRLSSYKKIIILKFLEKYGKDVFINVVNEYKLCV